MKEDLIYDVGAFNGDDTAHYLTKGFNVVAIEANPTLAQSLNQRFSEPIADGRLVVLNTGVTPDHAFLPFYVNDTHGQHSSFDKAAGTRGGRFHVIEVSGTPFREILDKYGVPYYLKIDIERFDRHCIEALSTEDLPAYISIEAHSIDYLVILHGLGYRHYKVIDQTGHNSPRVFDNETPWGRTAVRFEQYRRRLRNRLGRFPLGYPPGSSGPFAEETPGEWRDLATVAYDWLHFHTDHHKRGSLNPRGWFDFHAKL